MYLQTFKDFHPDFGSNIIHNFRVGSILSHEQLVEDFMIYPIPAKDEVIIKGDLSNIKDIQILDNSSRVLREISLKNNQSQLRINISNLSKGIYFITSKNKNVIKKFIKQ